MTEPRRVVFMNVPTHLKLLKEGVVKRSRPPILMSGGAQPAKYSLYEDRLVITADGLSDGEIVTNPSPDILSAAREKFKARGWDLPPVLT